MYNSTQPQKREINPLRTACGCTAHVGGYFNQTWFSGTWTTAKQGPYKDLQGPVLDFIRTIATVRNTKKCAEFCMPCIKCSVCPVYLLEPTPGMHCPLASGLGMNIFPASLLLAQVLVQFDFEFCNQNG